MTVEIISWSISTKAWDRAGIELVTPGSTVQLATESTTGPSSFSLDLNQLKKLNNDFMYSSAFTSKHKKSDILLWSTGKKS